MQYCICLLKHSRLQSLIEIFFVLFDLFPQGFTHFSAVAVFSMANMPLHPLLEGRVFRHDVSFVPLCIYFHDLAQIPLLQVRPAWQSPLSGTQAPPSGTVWKIGLACLSSCWAALPELFRKKITAAAARTRSMMTPATKSTILFCFTGCN